MSYIEKEKLIKADIASIENRVRHAFNQGYDLGFKDGKEKAKPLEQEQKWIPVSERLPDTDDEVLCWYEYYHWSQEKVLPEYGLGRYLRETSAWFGKVANGKDVRVIAWMPLPEPYESQEKEDK